MLLIADNMQPYTNIHPATKKELVVFIAWFYAVIILQNNPVANL